MEKQLGYPLQYLALGHSYLLHGHFEGWQTSGEWGMAASAPQADYFHKLQEKVSARIPCRFTATAMNCFDLEANCKPGRTKADYLALPVLAEIRSELESFKPNVITIFLGENIRTEDEKTIELFFDTLFSLIHESITEKTTVVCGFGTRQIAIPGSAAAKRVGFETCDFSYFHRDSSHNNPYYAFLQYPEYDDAAKAGAIEFRTHPGDFGHNEIAETLAEKVIAGVRQKLKPVMLEIPPTVPTQKTESKPQSSTNDLTKDSWDFSSADEQGVVFGGFNRRFRNGGVYINSAPLTGVAVFKTDLNLKGSYKAFTYRMILETEQERPWIKTVINTSHGEKEFLLSAKIGQMADYTCPLSEADGAITGFRIEPLTGQCNIGLEKIQFIRETMP